MTYQPNPDPYGSPAAQPGAVPPGRPVPPFAAGQPPHPPGPAGFPPGAAYPPPAPPAKKSRTGLIVALVAVLVVCSGCVVGGGLFAYGQAKDRGIITIGDPHVVYEVTGDGPAAIGYQDVNGSRDEYDVVPPWHREAIVSEENRAGVVAVLTGPRPGTISCKLIIDGVERYTETGSGPGAKAACNLN